MQMGLIVWIHRGWPTFTAIIFTLHPSVRESLVCKALDFMSEASVQGFVQGQTMPRITLIYWTKGQNLTVVVNWALCMEVYRKYTERSCQVTGLYCALVRGLGKFQSGLSCTVVTAGLQPHFQVFIIDVVMYASQCQIWCKSNSWIGHALNDDQLRYHVHINFYDWFMFLFDD